MQSVDSIETYAFGTSKDLVSEKEEIKYNTTIQKMINFDDVTEENIKEHNSNRPEFLDHPFKILIVGGSGTGKINALLNLINHEADIDKIYLYAKNLYEARYQFLINKRESTGFKYLNDSKLLLNTRMI